MSRNPNDQEQVQKGWQPQPQPNIPQPQPGHSDRGLNEGFQPVHNEIPVAPPPQDP